MTAKEFLKSKGIRKTTANAVRFPVADSDEVVELIDLMEAYAAAKIGWLDYPEHTPEEDEELIVWDGKEITSNVTYNESSRLRFVYNRLGYDGVEVKNVTKFMYLKNLKPE